jgi:TPR repeat protein
MPKKLIFCVSLPPATRSSLPIYDFAIANEELVDKDMVTYFVCCGKSICKGCIYSFCESSNDGKCPFCNSDQDKTDEEMVGEVMRRVEANDATSMFLLAGCYYRGVRGFQQDHAKAVELYARSADLGCSTAHNNLACVYDEGGDLKKAKFHYEAAAMAGHEVARFNLGMDEYNSGNKVRAVKHWMISASGGEYEAMHELRTLFEQGFISRDSIDSTLTAYNNACAEMRSEARDA